MSAKAKLIDTIKRVQDADEKLSPAALDILADTLIDAIRKEEPISDVIARIKRIDEASR